MTRRRQEHDPKERFRKGMRGERIAALLLKCKGYRILARRLRSGARGGGRSKGGGRSRVGIGRSGPARTTRHDLGRRRGQMAR